MNNKSDQSISINKDSTKEEVLKAIVKRDEIFLAKYRVTEPGVCFYFIDFYD